MDIPSLLTRLIVTGTLLCLASSLGAGCKPPPPGPLDDLPGLEGRTPDPTRLPGVGATPTETVGLSQILVAYIGVQEPKVRPRFGRPQALLRARHLAALARMEGTDFGQLAAQFSDDTDSSRNKGGLGVLSRGMLHPDLEEAAFALALGQISDPIETPRGFHILRRTEPTEVQAAEVVISYNGAKKFKPRNDRSRDEAAALAQAVVDRLRAGASFAEEARLHSDQANWESGGYFPIFKKGSHHPTFENIVWNTKPGEVSDPVETPTGFHVVGRWPALRIRGRVIKIPYLTEEDLAAARARPLAKMDSLKSRSAALAQAESVRRRIVEEGEDFAALAQGFLDHSLDERNGLVDWFGRAEIPFAVEQRAFALAPGAVSEIIEVGEAFFLFKRVP